jgi:DNA-binding response OmpR family regulator
MAQEFIWNELPSCKTTMGSTSNPEKNVLIAEDDDEDFYIFSFAINETKLAVALDRAEDGEILMKKLSERIPDILFLDINMPSKDGRQCIKDIRADHRYDEMPVIIYSSFEDLRNIEYCFREGANLYVVKPVYFGDFVKTIRRLLMMDRNAGLYFPAKSDFVVKQEPISNNS